MNNRKFLTVMAVFDAETQMKLAEIQEHLISNISDGTQTMGIPFHLTLGSYPADKLEAVIEQIKNVGETAKPFEISLNRYNNFGNKVFFLEPEITDELIKLRKSFECDYANGFDWVPHATLFCGGVDEVIKAGKIAPDIAFPLKTRIEGIELGEFFPPEKKFSITFKE